MVCGVPALPDSAFHWLPSLISIQDPLLLGSPQGLALHSNPPEASPPSSSVNPIPSCFFPIHICAGDAQVGSPVQICPELQIPLSSLSWHLKLNTPETKLVVFRQTSPRIDPTPPVLPPLCPLAIRADQEPASTPPSSLFPTSHQSLDPSGVLLSVLALAARTWPPSLGPNSSAPSSLFLK